MRGASNMHWRAAEIATRQSRPPWLRRAGHFHTGCCTALCRPTAAPCRRPITLTRSTRSRIAAARSKRSPRRFCPRASARADAERRTAEERERQAAAAARARELYDAAGFPSEGHPYLDRKGVLLYPGVKGADKWTKEWIDGDGVVHTKSIANPLLVPMHLSKTNIVSLQRY